MKADTFFFFVIALFTTSMAIGQSAGQRVQTDAAGKPEPDRAVVVVTGARFSYALVQKWIDEYNKVNPRVQIIIESRGSTDPPQYDILAEVYEHEDEIRQHREYIRVGRYAILPVANSHSAFAATYCDRGLNADLIKQVFFHNIFSDREKQKAIQTPFTAYTRLQKAGVPAVFSTYFGHKQNDLKGNVIAGSDTHLMKAVIRDSSGVSYLPLPLIYDQVTRKPFDGLVVLPVDLNGNKKINDEEKFYDTLDAVIERLEREPAAKISNVPIEYLHLSVDRKQASAEAVDFLKWVNENGKAYLHAFGYLHPEAKNSSQETFNEFYSKRGK